MLTQSGTVASVGETATTDVQRRRRASALPADVRRDLLIEAAEPLVRAKGEQVTTGEIAAAAGVAEGTLFRVFASKAALIEAVLDRALDPRRTDEALCGLARRRPSHGLEADVTAAVEVLQKRVVEVWQLLSGVGPRFRTDRRRPIGSPMLTTILERHRSCLDADPDEAGRILYSMTIATSHPLMAEQPLAPADVARRFLYGVAHREGAATC